LLWYGAAPIKAMREGPEAHNAPAAAGGAHACPSVRVTPQGSWGLHIDPVQPYVCPVHHGAVSYGSGASARALGSANKAATHPPTHQPPTTNPPATAPSAASSWERPLPAWRRRGPNMAVNVLDSVSHRDTRVVHACVVHVYVARLCMSYGCVRAVVPGGPVSSTPPLRGRLHADSAAAAWLETVRHAHECHKHTYTQSWQSRIPVHAQQM
jgi:hypothetical protein